MTRIYDPSPRAKRAFMWLCVAALALSSLPLYAISLCSHPYYDDFGFSAAAHKAWLESGSLSEVLRQAIISAREVRLSWQGTYTGTLLSNVQPGLFSERLYFIGAFLLLTSFILCFCFFFITLFRRVFGMEARASASLACLLTALMTQLMPDVGEAFYWFNGGIGNVFIYSLLALSAGLSIRLLGARSKAATVALGASLALLMATLGGGSYGGGLFGLCLYACLTAWLFIKRDRRKWLFLALWALFLGCFLYSVTAPGNGVRAYYIAKSGGAGMSPISAVLRALYYGVAQIGGYIRLPVIAVSLFFLPALYGAAERSGYGFSHPWLATLAAGALYCAQLAPPIYGGVHIGGGRIINTYFISFVALWFAWLYYIAGHLARRRLALPAIDKPRARGLALLCAALLLVGCLGFKRASDELPGVQNLSGVSAALSIATGEAQTYHAEMSAREALFNDPSESTVTLRPLSGTPAVFMGDIFASGDADGIARSLCAYYGKDGVILEGRDSSR